MVVGILDHQHGTRDIRRLPRPGRGWRPRARRRRRRRRRRWPASRCCSGSSPRRPTSTSSSTRAPAATLALAGVVVGSVLTVAYSIRFARRRRRAPGADAGAAGARRRPRPAAASRSSPRPRVLAAVTVVLGVVPGLVDGLVGAAAECARPRRRRGRTSRCGTASTSSCCCRPSPSPAASCSFVGRAGRRRGARRRRPRCRRPPAPTSASLRGLERRRRPGHRRRPARLAARLPRRDPAHRGGRARRAAARRHVVAGLAATSSTSRSTCRSPPCSIGLALAAAIVRRRFSGALFLGMVGYAMAGAVRRPGRTRPRAHPGRHRDAVDGAVRARAAPPARPLRDDSRRRPPRRPRRHRHGRRRPSSSCSRSAVGALDPPTDVSDAMIEQALPGGRRPQRRQRDPRRLPRLRHARRDHRARRGGDRHRRPRPRRAAAGAGRRAGRERRPPPVPLTRLVTVDVSVRIVFAAVMVGSLWLLFAGHNQPGGGFVGGLVAGAAVVAALRRRRASTRCAGCRAASRGSCSAPAC